MIEEPSKLITCIPNTEKAHGTRNIFRNSRKVIVTNAVSVNKVIEPYYFVDRIVYADSYLRFFLDMFYQWCLVHVIPLFSKKEVLQASSINWHLLHTSVRSIGFGAGKFVVCLPLSAALSVVDLFFRAWTLRGLANSSTSFSADVKKNVSYS